MATHYQTYLRGDKFEIPIKDTSPKFRHSCNYLTELCGYEIEFEDAYKNPSFGYWELFVKIRLERDFDESFVMNYVHDCIVKLEPHLGKINILTGNVNPFGSFVISTEVPHFKVKCKYMSLDLILPERSFHNVHKMIECEELTFTGNMLNIKDSVLGLLLIKGLTYLDFGIKNKKAPWVQIIFNHFKGDKDVLECQEELIENGFKEYAKL